MLASIHSAVSSLFHFLFDFQVNCVLVNGDAGGDDRMVKMLLIKNVNIERVLYPSLPVLIHLSGEDTPPFSQNCNI